MNGFFIRKFAIKLFAILFTISVFGAVTAVVVIFFCAAFYFANFYYLSVFTVFIGLNRHISVELIVTSQEMPVQPRTWNFVEIIKNEQKPGIRCKLISIADDENVGRWLRF